MLGGTIQRINLKSVLNKKKKRFSQIMSAMFPPVDDLTDDEPIDNDNNETGGGAFDLLSALGLTDLVCK